MVGTGGPSLESSEKRAVEAEILQCTAQPNSKDLARNVTRAAAEKPCLRGT